MSRNPGNISLADVPLNTYQSLPVNLVNVTILLHSPASQPPQTVLTPVPQTRLPLPIRCCLTILVVGFFAPPVFAQVADPILSVSAGPTAETVTVTVTGALPDDVLHYTTDGTPPTTSSAQVPVSGTLVINLDSTLKVQAYQGSAIPSNVVTALYSSSNQLTSGSQHSLLLKKDGTLWA